MTALILIPARMASTRLPGKPLADIGGRPMIVHVADRARESGAGRIVVATDADEIALAVRQAGYEAVMTRGDHQSGSDRIHEAMSAVDPRGEAGIVINLQGDLPTLDPTLIRAVAAPLAESEVDIATLGVEIADAAEHDDPNVVKIVGTQIAPDRLRALYFTRATAPWGDGPRHHHVGIYAYRRDALSRFVALGPSPLERRERLEQLRALEAAMRIDAAIVDGVPLGVDTPRDLERARAILCGDQA
jgi:3-deoxy-manno-octulosonate cytidylyltransferase (CMP-KDO synthetase)